MLMGDFCAIKHNSKVKGERTVDGGTRLLTSISGRVCLVDVKTNCIFY